MASADPSRHASAASPGLSERPRARGVPAGNAAARRAVYCTTAIDYANGVPHLGHALEKIQADCVARYHRHAGEQVHLVTGLDEHGRTVAQTAARAGVEPQEWVDGIATAYGEALRALAVSCDGFIRTSEPQHSRAVREILRRIGRRHPGDVYEAECAAFYCGGCEAFKRPGDLVEGHCANHPTIAAEWVAERRRFFRLSAYAGRLRALYDACPEFVVPEAAFAQIREHLAAGLEDVVISSNRLRWGIPFPGAPDETVHVWFDALAGYLSAAGFPDERYARLWPAELQIVGPDITQFHAVLWPALLIAAGLAPPRRIWTHGWLTMNGVRFSKSAGVHVALSDAVGRHGADALRYFLLLTMPWQGDGDFTWARFDAVYASDLARDIGDLAARVVAAMMARNGGRVPAAGGDCALDGSRRTLIAEYRRAMDALHLSDGARRLGRLASAARRYADEGGALDAATARRDQDLAALHRALTCVAVLAHPFMPGKAEGLHRMLGARTPVATTRWDELPEIATTGWQVVPGRSLFPVAAAG